MKRHIYTLAASSMIAVAMFAGPAVAGSALEAPARSVDLSTFDVNTEDGAANIYTRIEKAAEQVCHMTNSTRSLREQQNIETCVAGAVDAAVASIDSVQLKAVHAKS